MAVRGFFRSCPTTPTKCSRKRVVSSVSRSRCLRSVMSARMAMEPSTPPSALRSGPTESESSRTAPSLRTRLTSRPRMTPPALACAVRARPSAARSSGTKGGGRPTTSSRRQPNSSSAARFQICTSPPRSRETMGRGEVSTRTSKVSSAARSSRAAPTGLASGAASAGSSRRATSDRASARWSRACACAASIDRQISRASVRVIPPCAHSSRTASRSAAHPRAIWFGSPPAQASPASREKAWARALSFSVQSAIASTGAPLF